MDGVDADVAAGDGPFVVLLGQEAPTSRVIAGRVGKIPNDVGAAADFAVEPLLGLLPQILRHDACHLSHAQGVRAQPRAALTAIPDLDVVELSEPEICCGSAGIYNLLQPDAASDLGVRKAATVAAVAPDAVVTANPGCMLQIGRHLDADVPMLHPVQVVDASLRGRNPIG